MLGATRYESAAATCSGPLCLQPPKCSGFLASPLESREPFLQRFHVCGRPSARPISELELSVD